MFSSLGIGKIVCRHDSLLRTPTVKRNRRPIKSDTLSFSPSKTAKRIIPSFENIPPYTHTQTSFRKHTKNTRALNTVISRFNGAQLSEGVGDAPKIFIFLLFNPTLRSSNRHFSGPFENENRTHCYDSAAI